MDQEEEGKRTDRNPVQLQSLKIFALWPLTEKLADPWAVAIYGPITYWSPSP